MQKHIRVDIPQGCLNVITLIILRPRVGNVVQNCRRSLPFRHIVSSVFNQPFPMLVLGSAHHLLLMHLFNQMLMLFCDLLNRGGQSVQGI